MRWADFGPDAGQATELVDEVLDRCGVGGRHRRSGRVAEQTAEAAELAQAPAAASPSPSPASGPIASLWTAWALAAASWSAASTRSSSRSTSARVDDGRGRSGRASTSPPPVIVTFTAPPPALALAPPRRRRSVLGRQSSCCCICHGLLEQRRSRSGTSVIGRSGLLVDELGARGRPRPAARPATRMSAGRASTSSAEVDGLVDGSSPGPWPVASAGRRQVARSGPVDDEPQRDGVAEVGRRAPPRRRAAAARSGACGAFGGRANTACAAVGRRRSGPRRRAPGPCP